MITSPSRRSRTLAAAAATVCALTVSGALPASASASRAEPAAAEAPLLVSLGDSFISGEAGRWAGNSNVRANGYSGTDRAWDPATGKRDPYRVYGSSYDNGCNRSDVAEVQSVTLDLSRLNLACSGATSKAVLLPESGGKPFKGERSQAREISSVLADAADEGGAEFLDLSRSFEGREVCSTSTRQADAAHPPAGDTSEWVRFVTSGIGQGQKQESLHPNRYGQQALGTCLTLQLEQPSGDRRCTNAPGRGPATMRLNSID
ncbi:hypothetical protein SAMN05216483_3874 [Streptomyces sp. 2131.1]|uniref:hypothetical protein n=1 Tax=Streptomyces sp. 2131.1 TaxID=1855346 RepID=UPI0008989714|nr:hypothetical protein [Streptomyces sp. 2131.1]SED45626.1 hypothetical protein SAMN05216483_3874 [Streptomyces sp. 2131.1]